MYTVDIKGVDDLSEFSKRLINLRESHDWSKTYVASHIGLKNMQTYANWEYGKSEPDQRSTIKLANLFDVSTDYLLGNNEAPVWSTQKDIFDLGTFLDRNLKGAFFDGDELTENQKDKLKIALTQIFWDQLKKERRDSNGLNK